MCTLIFLISASFIKRQPHLVCGFEAHTSVQTAPGIASVKRHASESLLPAPADHHIHDRLRHDCADFIWSGQLIRLTGVVQDFFLLAEFHRVPFIGRHSLPHSDS